MSFLHKKEHRIFKPVEITIRRRLRCKKEKKIVKNGRDVLIGLINHIYMEMSY
jgi:hypothetical protein